MGVPVLELYDQDVVAEENLAPQGYRPDQLGMPKVEAMAADCRLIHPPALVIARNSRFRRSTAREVTTERRSLIVFCCVDSITTRRLVWEGLRQHAALFIDGRMTAEVIRVLAVASPSTDSHYSNTLFDSDEAYLGVCTARSTIYTASIAAGLMVGQLSKWLRNLPVDPDITLNLLAAELAVLNPSEVL
jgi:sulfur carrier protein ThiS adenylyltransferase